MRGRWVLNRVLLCYPSVRRPLHQLHRALPSGKCKLFEYAAGTWKGACLAQQGSTDSRLAWFAFQQPQVHQRAPLLPG